MYRCHDCGEVFSEPSLVDVSQTHEYWGATVTEPLFEETCTACGSDWIEEVNRCGVCGEGTADDCKYFCIECHENLSFDLKMIQQEMDLDFEQLQDIILEHFEGGYEFTKEQHLQLQKELEVIQHDYKIDYKTLEDFITEHFEW